MLNNKEKAFLRTSQVARMATADNRGRPHVVPICYVVDGDDFYTPIDEKPKTVAPRHLKRVRNIGMNPYVSIAVDRYDDNWKRLAYILIMGKARLLTRGLRHRKAVTMLKKKYFQYRSMVIQNRPVIHIRVGKFTIWGNL